MEALPGWSLGRNAVLVDQFDAPMDYTGNAIRAVSAAAVRGQTPRTHGTKSADCLHCFRPGFDVAIPLTLMGLSDPERCRRWLNRTGLGQGCWAFRPDQRAALDRPLSQASSGTRGLGPKHACI